MGWEKRGNGIYFYDKIREGDKVGSLYLCSERRFPEIGSILQGEKRKRRERIRQQERQEREQLEEMERNLKEIGRQIKNELSAVLLADGYHSHKGEWRK